MKRLVLSDRFAIISGIQRYFEKNEEARYIHRLHGVLLFASKEDESCDSIGALFGNSPRTVSNWIKKVILTGDLTSLGDRKRPGRTPRLNVQQKEELKQVLQQSPEHSGVSSNLRDGKSLSVYINERYGIELKVRACQNLFHEPGFSLKRARPVVCKPDEEKKEASKKNFKRK